MAAAVFVATVLLVVTVGSPVVEAFGVADIRHVGVPSTRHTPNRCDNININSNINSNTRLWNTDTDTTETVFPVSKTDDEWKEILTPDQYYILRKEGTETPGASPLNAISVDKNGPSDAGTFVCAGCDNPLFVADAKYDSGTGWPSFFAPVTSSAVRLDTDFKLVVPRTECVCSQCGGHLGHVFEDGPEPTGQRYCMNGAAMQFYRDSERPELAEQVSQMSAEDPFKLSATQTIPGAVINVIIGGIFFNAFLSSGQSTPIDFLTLLPATYYGFLAAKSIAKLMA
eukprot:jgi/Psemu1/213897/e_gw1.663.15.1